MTHTTLFAQDILIQGEGGAQILVEPDLAEHFESALTQVRTVPVETRVVPLSELRVAPPKKMAISSIEASLRLDAVASAGQCSSQYYKFVQHWAGCCTDVDAGLASHLMRHMPCSALRVAASHAMDLPACCAAVAGRSPVNFLQHSRRTHEQCRLQYITIANKLHVMVSGCAAGFRLARAKMSDLIKGGEVKLNWRPVSKPSTEVKAGDVVSCAGKGRLEILEINQNKKGKYVVNMERLV